MCDPLQTMLRAEGSDDEADVLDSMYESGTHRAKTAEVQYEREEPEPVTHRFWVQSNDSLIH